MNTRNKYIDGDINTAKQYRCDIIQTKYDGHWCRAVHDGLEVTYFSDTDRPFLTREWAKTSCVVIGEFMRGTQWAQEPSRKGRFFVWDLWELRGMAVAQPYKRRYTMLRALMPDLPENYILAPIYKLSDRGAVWQKFVEEEKYEGIIYRWSEGMNDHPIVREKKVFTLDGNVTGFEPGEGKHTGRVGVVLVRLPDGTNVKVGNGYSDEERQDMQDRPAAYIGKVMEFTCNAVFASGNVRHGRFLRWRDDK